MRDFLITYLTKSADLVIKIVALVLEINSMNALLVISTLNYSTPHNVWQPVLKGILTMQESVSNAIHPA
jgi:hypothetical protein